MPSGFDEFTDRAHRGWLGASAVARRHCGLVDRRDGVGGICHDSSEWWHYDDTAWRDFPLLTSSCRGAYWGTAGTLMYAARTTPNLPTLGSRVHPRYQNGTRIRRRDAAVGDTLKVQTDSREWHGTVRVRGWWPRRRGQLQAIQGIRALPMPEDSQLAMSRRIMGLTPRRADAAEDGPNARTSAAARVAQRRGPGGLIAIDEGASGIDGELRFTGDDGEVIPHET